MIILPIAKILVVDDRLENIYALERVLSRPGLEILTASTGNDALALILEHDFDLVLLDVQMPDMDGFELAKIIKNDKRTKEVPIIFVTAINKEKKYLIKGYELGAVDYIVKPIDADILRQKINALLSLKSTSRNLQRTLEEKKQELNRQKEAESNLLKHLYALKMESIGTLAAGIAHQFNNTLLGITGNIEILKALFPYDKKIKKYVAPMSEATKRMVHLTKQLTAYARGGKYNPRPLSINELITGMMPAGMLISNKEIKVVRELGTDIPQINGDAAQLLSVLLAIATNAVEAIEGPGTIKIVTTHEEIDIERAKEHPARSPGHFACLTVSDTGKGMDEKTIEKIFEPFFSTKFLGRGLGMAAAYGILNNHKGWIEVSSETGKGTTVRTYLPVSHMKLKKTTEDTIKIAKTKETILLIEDDEIVAELAGNMIEMLGHNVLTAKTGKEATFIAENHTGEIGLAFLDFGLPDMDCREVCKGLEKLRPKIKIIVCTGNPVEHVANELAEIKIHGYVQKPYSFAGLSGKLREVLNCL
ncbi:MAG: response regulator [Desulfobulbaceae bacterium]|nr:response regulator [Desulfobulbaceae bacterium]MCK5322602.1 response regulator [Desulfobulbaceae bacterium]